MYNYGTQESKFCKYVIMFQKDNLMRNGTFRISYLDLGLFRITQ